MSSNSFNPRFPNPVVGSSLEVPHRQRNRFLVAFMRVHQWSVRRLKARKVAGPDPCHGSLSGQHRRDCLLLGFPLLVPAFKGGKFPAFGIGSDCLRWWEMSHTKPAPNCRAAYFVSGGNFTVGEIKFFLSAHK
jgi:hypothetical protein